MAAVLLRSSKMVKWNVRSLSFESFGLESAMVKRLKRAGIVKPTEIQEKAIGHVMMGKSTIINAETGSGKTLCYLLPIVNALLADKALATRPPYALILLPTIELCHQVADVFRTVGGPALLPSIVHRDERLQLSTWHRVVMATPSSLLSYRTSVLKNARVVVVDEADHMITSGGKDVWTILNFLKDRTAVENAHLTGKNRKVIGSDFPSVGESRKEEGRQFVFVAATLPTRGRKAAYHMLRRWLPDAELITSSLVHQTVPDVQIKYVKVEEELKLQALLHCLDCLAGECALEISETTLSTELSSHSTLHDDHNGADKSVNAIAGGREVNYEDYKMRLWSGGDDCNACNGVHRHSRAPGELRVLVFANSAKRATQAFRFVNGVKGEGGQPPLAHEDDSRLIASTRDASTPGTTSGGGSWESKCGQIHKDVPPSDRITALKKFKTGELSVLVCTDLAARGLDLPRVSHVIQLDFAPNAAQVLHRTGRTARAGSSGTVINFVTRADEDLVQAVRSSQTGPGAPGYQSTFSRNRMFRRRVKAGKLSASPGQGRDAVESSRVKPLKKAPESAGE